MKDKAGQEATDTYQRAKKNLEDATANKQQIVRDTGGAYKNGFIGIGGKHSSNAHINESMSSADWQRISQITGENVRSASDFWNLTSEQMAKVADEATDLWSKIKNASNDGYKSNASNMDEYIEYYKKLIDLQNDYNEAVTNLSFDNTRDGLKELLSDTTKGVKDATKKVKEYMEEAVLTYITKTTLAKDMQDWYTQFASAMADGKLDQSEKLTSKRNTRKHTVRESRQETTPTLPQESTQRKTTRRAAPAQLSAVRRKTSRTRRTEGLPAYRTACPLLQMPSSSKRRATPSLPTAQPLSAATWTT